MSHPTPFLVKPEPCDVQIAPLYPSTGPLSSNVKDEVADLAIPNINGTQARSSSNHGYQVPKAEKAAREAYPISFAVYGTAAEIAYVPEAASKEGAEMVKTIKGALQKLELGSKLRNDVWNREIESLEGQVSPKTLVAVCGATGAGKSSILNAILDDNVVPTSGMRACTAVVTELAYHKKSTVDADISFLSEEEWRQELKVLLHDLTGEDGNIKRITDLKSDSGVAWQKVHAVYPAITPEALIKMEVDEIIKYDPAILRILGTTKQISAKDSKTFSKEISIYIDSKDQKRSKKDKTKSKDNGIAGKSRQNAFGTTSTNKDVDNSPALWPLIRQVNVRCRSKALSTGVVLVDLPGVADANAARNNIAKDYMKKCNCVWILAPITRAVDDKTARDLLGEAFKIQLMNGNYDDHAITFIASKCDDISCSEVIRALRLEENPILEEIQGRLNDLQNKISTHKAEKRNADKLVKEIEKELKLTRAQVSDHEDHLEALRNGEVYVSKLKPAKKATSNNKKRKNTFGGSSSKSKRQHSALDSDNDFIDDDDSEDIGSSDSDESSEENSDGDDNSDVDMASQNDSEDDEDDGEMEEVTQDSLKEKIKERKLAIKATRETLNAARSRKKALADSLSSFEKGAAKVQKEKNAFCSLSRSEYSQQVLKADFRAGLKDLDDAAAEARDPDNFDPNANVRDYDAIDLPVFTCSSRDYVRLTGQAKGDGPSSCFSNVEDTGIPALQKWCHQLTIASRERGARTFMAHVKAFAQTIQRYVEGNDEVTAGDREKLRQKWESQDFGNVGDYADMMNDPLHNLLGGLGGDIGAGLYTLTPKVDPYGEATGVTPRLCRQFAKIVDECVNDLKTRFKDGLEEKCTSGANYAANAAIGTLEDFVGSMHWATYRASLRRHGAWRRDLNVELTNPFTRNIAHSWSQVFESDLFAPFQEATLGVIKTLVTDVEESAAVALRDRTKVQGEVCVEEACLALAKAVDQVKAAMNVQQKEVSRCMAPHVQAQLVDGYEDAMLERGIGSVARQKAVFHRYLDSCKDNIFDDGATVVLDRLTAAAEAIGEILDEAMGKLAQKIEVSLAVLWEATRQNPAQQVLREKIVELVKTVQRQIVLWTEADGMKQQANKSSLEAMDED